MKSAPGITGLQALLAQLEIASDHVYQLCLPLNGNTAGLQLQGTLVLTVSLIKLTHAQISFACSQSMVMLIASDSKQNCSKSDYLAWTKATSSKNLELRKLSVHGLMALAGQSCQNFLHIMTAGQAEMLTTPPAAGES